MFLGLRILYIDEEEYDLHEVGYFDAFPPDDALSYYEGVWSVYPFFPSGKKYGNLCSLNLLLAWNIFKRIKAY